MVLLNKSLEEMMVEIECTSCVFFDYWRPVDYPSKHEVRDTSHGRFLNVKEEYVNRVLENIPEECDIEPDNMLVAALNLALENSLTRGHYCDMYYPLSVKILAGEKGCIIRIRDSGIGFAYEEHIKEVMSGGRGLRNGSGMGTAILDSPSFEASYEGDGSVLNIIVKKGYCPERTLELLRAK